MSATNPEQFNVVCNWHPEKEGQGPLWQEMANKKQQDSTPSAEQARAQKDRILASKLFALAKRQRSFLDFIVNAKLEGREDKLKEFALGIDVFERDETFDPNIDSIVRVEASRLRAKLREYYDGEGRQDPVRIEIPKGHYVPTFRFNQRIGVRSDARANASSGFAGGKIGMTVIGFLIVAILFLLMQNFVLEQKPADATTAIDDKSIAVLPFVSMTSGEDDEYFADGLTEEILNSLAQVRELRVTARTSSFYFKGKNLLVSDIATRLGVAHVVEGTVRRDGDRLRIAAQLIRASDEFHLWSQTYDRKRADVFKIQEEIAEEIAEVLGVVLDENAREIMRNSGINDVEAFIAYQKGREAFADAHQGMNMADALEIANAHFDIALEAAPSLAAARVMKADLRGHVLFEITAGIRDEKYPGELSDALAGLREEYRLAVELAPVGNQRDLIDLERTLFSDNWIGLPFQIEKALQPDGCAQTSWTNAFISPFGWAEQMSAKFRDSAACNPLDVNASYLLAFALLWSGDANAALRAVTEANSKGLTHPFLEDARFWALLATGRVNDPGTFGSGTGGGNMPFDRQILREALSGNSEVARQMAEDYWAGLETNEFSTLVLAAVVGDRVTANNAAARIDAHPGSIIVLGSAVATCYCGAPFDLDAAPNYKARIEEAGFPWPPPKIIEYPTKTW